MVSDRISRFILEIDEETLDALPIEQALEHILIAYGDLTLDEETSSNLRLVFAECDRFPELAAAFSELAIRRTTETMERLAEAAARPRARSQIDDPATPSACCAA